MPEQPQWSERTLDMPPQDPWAEHPTVPSPPAPLPETGPFAGPPHCSAAPLHQSWPSSAETGAPSE